MTRTVNDLLELLIENRIQEIEFLTKDNPEIRAEMNEYIEIWQLSKRLPNFRVLDVALASRKIRKYLQN